MKKKTRVAVIAILSAAVLISLGRIAYELIEYRRGGDTYKTASELSGLPDFSSAKPDTPEKSPAVSGTDAGGENAGPVWVDPYAETLKKMDFTALRKQNGDVLGWILIPGTQVSYPLMYSSTRQSTYYLNHTWSGGSGMVGSIYLDPAVKNDFSGFNTVIYGHNMNDGSMFGALKSFKSQSYWKAHPDVYITTDNGTFRYQIFAAYEVVTDGETYDIGFSSDTKKQEFIDFCLRQSAIKTGVVPTAGDSVITLSTCTGRGHATRWVVQAVLKNTAPAGSTAPAQNTAPEEVPAVNAATGTDVPELTPQPGGAAPSDNGNAPVPSVTPAAAEIIPQ